MNDLELMGVRSQMSSLGCSAGLTDSWSRATQRPASGTTTLNKSFLSRWVSLDAEPDEMNKAPQSLTGPPSASPHPSTPLPAPSPGLSQPNFPPAQPPSVAVFATPPPPMNPSAQPRQFAPGARALHQQGGFRSLQPYYTSRPTLPTNSARVQPSSAPRPIPPSTWDTSPSCIPAGVPDDDDPPAANQLPQLTRNRLLHTWTVPAPHTWPLNSTRLPALQDFTLEPAQLSTLEPITPPPVPSSHPPVPTPVIMNPAPPTATGSAPTAASRPDPNGERKQVTIGF
ncbi:hypothetical protein SRHO_G00210400 [Serrasalmus rhombeus]